MDWVVFGLRVLIGGIFLAAGALKVGHHIELAATIAGFRLLPEALIAPLALALPYAEIVLGLYVLVGLFTRIVGAVAAAQLAIFAVAIASVVIRGIKVACGCFGDADTAPATWLDVARDVALAVAALLIAWRAPGHLAVDRLLWPSGSWPVSRESKRI